MGELSMLAADVDGIIIIALMAGGELSEAVLDCGSLDDFPLDLKDLIADDAILREPLGPLMGVEEIELDNEWMELVELTRDRSSSRLRSPRDGRDMLRRKSTMPAVEPSLRLSS